MVGLVVLVLAVVGIAGLAIVGGRLAQQISEDPEAFFGGPCGYVTDVELSRAVGEDVTALTLEGFADGTMGALLDKRLLRDAPDCWIASEDGLAARIAVSDGNGAAVFEQATSAAVDGGFRGTDVPGLGDGAFCTELSEAGSSGVLVRFGERVVYASVAARDPFRPSSSCDLAVTLASTLEP